MQSSMFLRNYVFVAVSAGNIISFITGTSLTWSSPILQKLNGTDDNPLGHLATDDERSLVGSLLAIGAIFGPFIFGIAADKFGRKPVLLSLAIPYFVSYLIMAFAEIIELFYVARVLIGLAVGGVFTVIPMYIGEVAADSNRGALGASMNSFITFGLLFSYAIGPYCPIMYFHIILAVFPVIYFVAFFMLAPESPYYLIRTDKAKAMKSLAKLRGSDDVQKELEEIKESVEKGEGGSFMDIFKSKGLRKGFLIGVGLIFFQQFSGINVVLFYAQDVFKATGGSLPSAVGPIIVGVVQFFAGFITPLTSDRSGRKILLLISHVGMLIAEVPLGVFFYLQQQDKDVTNIGWLPVACLVIYIIFYNVASGPVPWAILGELFPSNVKSIASSTTASICWIFGFLITKFFANISSAIGMGPTFWIFAACCLLAVIFVQFYVIETKGKSLQQIQDELDS